MIGARSESYGYDSLHRLTGWTLRAGRMTKATEYQYDEIGNLTRVLLGGLEQERNQYTDPRPHALSENLGGRFVYDDRGRLHQGPDRTIDYTSFDLPRQITTAAGTTRFDYDSAGVRVRKEGPDGAETITIGGLYERRKTAAGTEHVFQGSRVSCLRGKQSRRIPTPGCLKRTSTRLDIQLSVPA
jgi:YD repeat-containing protein